MKQIKRITILCLLIGTSIISQAQKNQAIVPRDASGHFVLPVLPYGMKGLAPVISEKTVKLHYGKHFQTYVNNLNKLIKGTSFEKMSIEDIVIQSDGAIFNNAGQSLNHAFYFAALSPQPNKKLGGKLLQAIEKKWGSFDNFKKEFMSVANGVFGSGWAWLSKTPSGELEISGESNAGNPLKKGNTPLLVMDVWEHAYYVDYENRRAEHVERLWEIIDWEVVESRYK